MLTYFNHHNIHIHPETSSLPHAGSPLRGRRPRPTSPYRVWGGEMPAADLGETWQVEGNNENPADGAGHVDILRRADNRHPTW